MRCDQETASKGGGARDLLVNMKKPASAGFLRFGV